MYITCEHITNIYLLSKLELFRTQVHAMRLLKELKLSTYEQKYDGKTLNIFNQHERFHTNTPLDLMFTSFWFAYDIATGMKTVFLFCRNLLLFFYSTYSII